MRKALIKISAFWAIALGTLACINESDFVSPVPIPDVPIELVLHADLCPQNDTHWVDVSFSKPLFKPTSFEFQSPERAIVNIIEEGGRTSPNLVFEPNLKKYFVLKSEFGLTGGKKYTVKATATVNRVAYTNQGTTTIPSILPTNFSFIVDTFFTNNLSDKYKLSLYWNDPANSVDYFQYKAWYQTENADPSGTGVYRFWSQISFNDDRSYKDDVRLNGKEIRINDGSMPISQSWFDPSYEPQIIRIRSLLIYGNNDWYRYQSTRENDTAGDPFSNPRLNFSNCDNGYGVVCAYNRLIIDKEYE